MPRRLRALPQSADAAGVPRQTLAYNVGKNGQQTGKATEPGKTQAPEGPGFSDPTPTLACPSEQGKLRSTSSRWLLLTFDSRYRPKGGDLVIYVGEGEVGICKIVYGLAVERSLQAVKRHLRPAN